MKLLDEETTAALLPYDRLVGALRDMMRDRREGRVHAPPRTVLPLPDGGAYLAMSACDSRLAISKLVAVTPANRGRDLPTLHGTVIVADARDGRMLYALDGPTVTARRTAALTLLGTELLAPQRPRRVALIGTGVQARAHAIAVHERWRPERLAVVGRSPASTQAFVASLQAAGVNAQAASRDDALDGCDLIVCLTTSREPVLPESVPPQTLVVGVGAFTPAMAEIPPGLARSRIVVVDDLHGARAEAGDLLQAGIDWDTVLELADCLDGAPTAHDGIVLKTVGHATWDLAAARVAVRDLPH